MKLSFGFGGEDTFSPADRNGLIVGFVVALAATAILAWPRGVIEPAFTLKQVQMPKDIAADAFLAKAPFDPKHRPETSNGELPSRSGPVSAQDPIVTGILVEGGTRRAMFSSEPARWLEEGGTADGWRITRIEPETITLEKGGKLLVLTYSASLKQLSR